MRRVRRRHLLAVLAVALGPTSGAAAAAAGTGPARSGSRAPLKIRSTSLSQQGQRLAWRVRLATPFSPAGLAPGGRSLCLLIEGATFGRVDGQLCLLGPHRHSLAPRLVYMAINGKRTGPRQVISATVTRLSPSAVSASFLPSAIGRGYEPLRWQAISTLRAAACAPPRTGSSRRGPDRGCFELSPARPALLRLHVPVPVGCVVSGPSPVYQGRPDRREIALTFDDGPANDPPTLKFLQVLEREHVPATFFEIGDQISAFDPGGAVERRMLSDGDMIGDHSWSHPRMTSLRPAKQRAQLLDAAAAIRHATHGFTPCLWRPPYGAISPRLVSLARSLGLLTVMWDIDPRDWALPGVRAIYSNVIDNAHNGAIVIQHVGGGPRQQTLAALPHEIEVLRARGYEFVTVDQLLGLKLLYR
jgi:peptidoglycan/xylan/chitin deacetylase (PgdA/CDA1 family)